MIGSIFDALNRHARKPDRFGKLLNALRRCFAKRESCCVSPGLPALWIQLAPIVSKFVGRASLLSKGRPL